MEIRTKFNTEDKIYLWDKHKTYRIHSILFIKKINKPEVIYYNLCLPGIHFTTDPDFITLSECELLSTVGGLRNTPTYQHETPCNIGTFQFKFKDKVCLGNVVEIYCEKQAPCIGENPSWYSRYVIYIEGYYLNFSHYDVRVLSHKTFNEVVNRYQIDYEVEI
jgi:hypothetical protein